MEHLLSPAGRFHVDSRQEKKPLWQLFFYTEPYGAKFWIKNYLTITANKSYNWNSRAHIYLHKLTFMQYDNYKQYGTFPVTNQKLKLETDYQRSEPSGGKVKRVNYNTFQLSHWIFLQRKRKDHKMSLNAYNLQRQVLS